MTCTLSEQELWSGLDRNAPDIADHLGRCPDCRRRADALRAGISAVAQASTPAQPPLPERIGSYIIRRRLGQGGMGIVYEGEQAVPKRLVAVKVVRGEHHFDPYRVRLFEREAQTLARLKHPAIAAIFEGGRTPDGQPFFAMELVQGVPLTDHVRARTLPRRQRLALFLRICEAINYAHQRGVIHRDLKPSNILIDAEGNPKILDFGLARITDPDVAIATATLDVGRIMGTLPYMSPEEARGNTDEIDVRSDVYSLGVILYELLTDRLPLTVSRVAIAEAVRVICEQTPRAPGAIDRNLRGDLETIMLKALEKQPSRRYKTVAAFADDIARYLTDQPVLARRAGPSYRIRKWLVRHAIFVAVTLSIAGVCVASFVWITRGERILQQEAIRTADLQDLRVAVRILKLAMDHAEIGRLAVAEQEFREALATFERQEREEYIPRALLGLATVLYRRDASLASEVEPILLDALDWFDAQPTYWRVERREALMMLRELYQPQRLDRPNALKIIETEIESLGPPDPIPLPIPYWPQMPDDPPGPPAPQAPRPADRSVI